MKPLLAGAGRLPLSAHERGFSLIELLITITIMLILFTMMFGFGSKRNQLTQKQRCQGNLQKIHIALQIWANEHEGQYPAATNAVSSEDTMNLLVPQYSADTGIFVCPGSKDRPLPAGESLRQGRISYAYYQGRRVADGTLPLLSDKQVDASAKVLGQALFSPDGKKPGNNHHKYGGNVLFCDGSVKSSPAAAAFDLPLGTNVVLLNPKP
jgi:prepilin-type N-terminal cleavage/methylation domain-containing protein/prepilin-type processing-associated H-X9-DG protein